MASRFDFTVELAYQKSFSVDFLCFSHMGFNQVWLWHWCCERQAECKLYVAWNTPVIIPRLRMGIRWKLVWLGTSFSQVDLQIGRNERENNAISETWATVLNVHVSNYIWISVHYQLANICLVVILAEMLEFYGLYSASPFVHMCRWG